MCVIVFKPAGAETPPLSILKHCWDRNDHGAGVALSEARCVFYHKGLMTWKDFERYYKETELDKRRGQAIAFHFRIGTHGNKDAGNTHPFVISEKPEDLRTLIARAPSVIMHNGIFQLEPKLPLISDTGQFVVDCVKNSGGDPIKHWEDNEKIRGWSKMIVMLPSNSFKLLGSWSLSKHCPESFCSNTTWEPYTSYTYTGGGYGYGEEWRGGRASANFQSAAASQANTAANTATVDTTAWISILAAASIEEMAAVNALAKEAGVTAEYVGAQELPHSGVWCWPSHLIGYE